MTQVPAVPLRATTRLVGVMGFPVEHSLSPPMHNAAFATLGLDWAYVAFRVEPERVEEALRGIRGLGLVGLNVTIPHKQAAADLVDELDDAACVLGSVNTIHNRNGVLRGYSTDGAGFVRSVEETGATLGGKTVTLIGAGGSARAVAYALVSAGIAQLTIAARRVHKAEEIVAVIGSRATCPVAVANLHSDAAQQAVAHSDIVVDSTSVGMAPNADVPPVIPPDWLRPGQLVCDLTYTPRETCLLKAARAVGADTLDGTGMLVHQGAIAFEIWTGIKAPVETMRRALLAALKL